MFDSWGDGWNGATYTVTDANGTVMASGGLASGSSGTDTICLPDGCYDISVGGGSFDSEITFNFGSLTGVTAGTYNVCFNVAVLGCTDPAADNFNSAATQDDGSCIFSGCTDPTASNYDANATVDDGSCTYPCTDNAIDMVMFDSWGDGWNGATYTVTDGTTTATGGLTTGSTATDALCLPDGCYDVTVGGGSYDSEITFDFGSLVGATAGTYQVAVGAGSCAVFGCTDSTADNYDPAADTDDGSCIISGCTDPAADNYNASANNDDGSCTYTILGCTDPNADNYDSSATSDDGSCSYCSTFALSIDSQSDASAAGACDGSAVVSGSGGTSPYSIAWPADPTTLCAGTYTVTATDAEGCTASIDVTIAEPSAPSVTSLISECDDFVSGPSAWPYVLVATTVADGAASQGAQTFTMNITSLPAGGANVRVYKTTANGGDFFANPVALTLGSNSITVGAVSFDRAVKFQFSSGDVEFDALSLNGVDSDCLIPAPTSLTSLISDCSDFTSGPSAWPYVLTATTIADGVASQAAQTFTMNVTSLPAGGANFRVFKTTANGGTFFGNAIALTLGSNSITVGAVSFDRAVKFQFSSGDVEFDALSVNGVDSDCIGTTTPIPGCTDPTANNYDASATVDDGSCTFDVFGCTDSNADNYDASATVDDGSCTYTSVCSVPDGLNTYNVVHTRATFNFNSTGADYYKIRVKENGGAWQVITQLGTATGTPGGNTKTKYFLTSDASYEWQVRAWCMDGSVSGWSSSAFFNTLPDCPNADNLYASDIEAEWAVLNWDAPTTTVAGVNYYLARIQEDGASAWNIVTPANGGTDNFKLKGQLIPGATYNFEVRTWCNTGDANNPTDPYYKSDWGGSGLLTTIPCPIQTFNLSTTNVSATTQFFGADFIADGTTPYDHFTLRFREVGATAWQFRSITAAHIAAGGRNVGGLTTGATYEWGIRTFCGTGSTWKSPWASGPDFTAGSSSKLAGPVTALEVYPNPSDDIFNIGFVSEEAQTINVKVVNMIGEVVYTENLEEFMGNYANSIDMNTQPKGVYFLEITTNNGSMNHKIVLQ